MQVNDYAKWGGHPVKIISQSNNIYGIRIITTNKTRCTKACYHISLLKRGVLEACGFKKSNIGNYFDCQLQNHLITADIRWTRMYFANQCYITISNIGLHCSQSHYSYPNVISLDNLQDFVRDKTGMELNIDEKKLNIAVKNNLWR